MKIISLTLSIVVTLFSNFCFAAGVEQTVQQFTCANSPQHAEEKLDGKIDTDNIESLDHSTIMKRYVLTVHRGSAKRNTTISPSPCVDGYELYEVTVTRAQF